MCTWNLNIVCMHVHVCVYTAVFDEVDLNLSMHVHGYVVYVYYTHINCRCT